MAVWHSMFGVGCSVFDVFVPVLIHDGFLGLNGLPGGRTFGPSVFSFFTPLSKA
jgi:hypothetical protein